MTKQTNTMPASFEAGPMDQVRELLFGAQLKEMDIRLQRQEERFQRDTSDARESLKARIDSLENFMKSEVTTLLHRLKEEHEERDSLLKVEQRERVEALKTEQRERSEALKIEQRERAEAVRQLEKDLASATEMLERKLTKVSSTLDNAERELRQLLGSETGALSEKIDEKYHDALGVISSTAAQIRHDMVYRSSLSSMFTEMVVKLSGQWTQDVSTMFGGSSPDYGQAPLQSAPEIIATRKSDKNDKS